MNARQTMRMAGDWFLSGVGELVRQTREDAGLSMAALAAKIGVSKSTIENVENGESCAMFTLYRIAQGLGVPADDLLPVEVKS